MWGVHNFLLTNSEGADPQVFCAMTLQSDEGEKSRGLLCLPSCWSPYGWFAAVYHRALKMFALPVLCCNRRIIQKLRKKSNSFLALEARKFKIRGPASDKSFIALHPVVGNGRQKQERSIPFQTECSAPIRACLSIPLSSRLREPLGTGSRGEPEASEECRGTPFSVLGMTHTRTN